MSKRPRHVMVFDPGQTIGVAVLKRGGACVVTKSIETDGTRDWRQRLEQVFNAYAPSSELVVEQGPDFGRHNRGILSLVERELTWLSERYGLPINWIRPADWKGHPAARPDALDGNEPRTQHEKDTLGMGRVWCHLNKGEST